MALRCFAFQVDYNLVGLAKKLGSLIGAGGLRGVYFRHLIIIMCTLFYYIIRSRWFVR